MLPGVYSPARAFENTRRGRFSHNGGALYNHGMHITRMASSQYYRGDGCGVRDEVERGAC